MCLFSQIWPRVKMWSIQIRPGRKLVRFSGAHFSQEPANRKRKMPVSTSATIITKLIPLWFAYEDLLPFFQIGTVTNSHQSLTICSLAHADPRGFVNFEITTPLPPLKKNWVPSYGPTVICLLSNLSRGQPLFVMENYCLSVLFHLQAHAKGPQRNL